MSKIASVLKTGAAATAIAASATVVQAPVAQAAPAAPPPEIVGAALGAVGCLVPVFNANECATVPAAALGGFFYLGAIDPTPPPRLDFLVFNPAIPLSLIPGLGPLVAGFIAALNLEACVGGLSVRAGGYGTITASLGSGC